MTSDSGGNQNHKDLYEELGTQGQKPKVLLIGRIDSRIDLGNIFNVYPGQMFPNEALEFKALEV